MRQQVSHQGVPFLDIEDAVRQARLMPGVDGGAGAISTLPRNRSGGGALVAMMRILSARGDTVVEWNEKHAEVGDPEALKAVREAERIFEQQRQKGATAFEVEQGKPSRRLETFDPKVEQMVVVPPVAGG